MSEEKRIQTFEEFEPDWKRRHRSSIPRRKRVVPVQQYFWIVFWLVVASGAAIYSAAHTVPAAEMTIFKDTPNRGQLALTVFVIVELVIFGAAAKRREIGWLKWLLIGAVAVALAGNIGSSVRAVADNGGDWLNQVGGILLAIIAPITALAAGEVLHLQLDERAKLIQAAEAEFEQKWKEVEATINREYTRYVKEAEKAVQLSLSARTGQDRTTPDEAAVRPASVRTDRTGYGYERTSDAQQKALDWFGANPDKVNLPLRTLEDLIGVGKTTVGDARKEWQRQQALTASVNGNGHSEAQP